MTVKELEKLLSTCDDNAEIVFIDTRNALENVSMTFVNLTYTKTVVLTEEDDTGSEVQKVSMNLS